VEERGKRSAPREGRPNEAFSRPIGSLLKKKKKRKKSFYTGKKKNLAHLSSKKIKEKESVAR